MQPVLPWILEVSCRTGSLHALCSAAEKLFLLRPYCIGVLLEE